MVYLVQKEEEESDKAVNNGGCWVRVDQQQKNFSQESVEVPAGLLKDVKKVRGPLEQILK